MELREYLRILRRGWLVIALLTVVGVGLSVLYVSVTPKQYVATSAVTILPNSDNLTELAQGQQYAESAAGNYAQLINSSTVLSPVASKLGLTVSALRSDVVATVQDTTAAILIQVRAGSAADAADIANATANSASTVIPKFVANSKAQASLIEVLPYQLASVPTSPASPNAPRIILIGFAIGLALGLALALARATLDTRLRTREDVKAITSIPVMAVIPRTAGKHRAAVVVRDFPQSSAGETFRSLRTNLARLESGERRSIACAGVANDREGGKIALNLAWSLANVGWHVLYIDLNLRSMTSSDELGAASVLAGEAEWRQVVRPTSQPKLDTIAAGKAHGNPSDLLGGRRTKLLLQSVEAAYDYVVVHVPPLLAWTDAAVVARATGHTLVTVSARRTRSADLTNAVSVLRNVQVEPIGLVLAGTRASTTEIITFQNVRSRPKPMPSLPSSNDDNPNSLARSNGSR